MSDINSLILGDHIIFQKKVNGTIGKAFHHGIVRTLEPLGISHLYDQHGNYVVKNYSTFDEFLLNAAGIVSRQHSYIATTKQLHVTEYDSDYSIRLVTDYSDLENKYTFEEPETYFKRFHSIFDGNKIGPESYVLYIKTGKYIQSPTIWLSIVFTIIVIAAFFILMRKITPPVIDFMKKLY